MSRLPEDWEPSEFDYESSATWNDVQLLVGVEKILFCDLLVVQGPLEQDLEIHLLPYCVSERTAGMIEDDDEDGWSRAMLWGE